jgi:glycosyltransferase involved in cell wall biosynthesis
MKKIAFFHPYFSYGGVEKTNIRLSKYFREHGYAVDFLALSFTDHFQKEMEELGIRRVEFAAHRTIQAVPELRRYLAEEQKKSEELYLISCQNFANLIAAASIPRKRERLGVILSERLHPAEFSYNGKAKKGKLILFLMKHMYQRADAVVANSKETAAEIERITGVPTRAIYNPTLTEDYEALAGESVSQKWFEEDIPVIISVGRLSHEKGYDTLLKAFARVQTAMDSRLVIIGEGGERKNLETLAETLGVRDKVWMPGYDANPYKYVSKADVFVLSSRFEGLPNTLIEALAVGTPCVATRCKSGPAEILLDGAGGLLVDVEDERQMADAIVETLTNREEAAERLNEAKKMLNRFTPDEVGRQYEDLLLDTLHGKCRNH